MTVYLDVIFIENLAMNYIILIATGLVNKIKIKQIRVFVASFVGAIYSVIAYISLEKIENSIIVKIIFSILIIYIAFKPKKMNKLAKELLIFYLTTFAFGGITFYLIYTVKPKGIFFKDGVWIGTYPLKIAIAGGVLGFLIIYLSFKVIKNGISKKNMMCNIEIVFENKSKIIKAMVDSGNLLKDPISKAPVVVVEKDMLNNIIPNAILDNLENILKGENIEDDTISKYISKFKIIPFSSIGKQNGMLLGIKSDEVNVFTDNGKVKIKSAIIGIYDKPLCRNSEYKGLVGLDFVEKECAI